LAHHCYDYIKPPHKPGTIFNGILLLSAMHINCEELQRLHAFTKQVVGQGYRNILQKV
jgi:hypothetical protein